MVAGVLLHVGMHKTGTTALQDALDGYDDGRLRYARLGHPNHSIPFLTLYASEPHRYHVWQRMGATRDEVARIRARHEAALAAELALDRERLLVVGEEISLMASVSVGRMARHLGDAGREVAVLAYLRDPMGYAASAFQQQVRGGQSCFTLPRPHYRQRFEKFIAAFGADAVRFRPYRAELFPGGSVIADYAAVAGLPTGALTEGRSNRALSTDAVRLIHLLNRSVPPLRSEQGLMARSALVRHLGALFGGSFALGPEITAGILDPADIAWMEETAGLGFGPLPAPVERDVAEAALARHLAAIPPEVVDRLRHDLARRGQSLGVGADAASLVAALYHLFLEQAARAAPRRATG